MSSSFTKHIVVEVTCRACGVGVRDTLPTDSYDTRKMAAAVLKDKAHEWVQAHTEFIHKKCLKELAPPPTPPEPESCDCGRVACEICQNTPT